MQAFFHSYHQYIQSTDTLVLGVSGGVDSMVLLHLIGQIHPRERIIVCHLNHSLRGDESDADMELVADICKRENIEYIGKTVDIGELSSEQKMSVEMAARQCRYEFLEQVRKERSARYILTAHHLDDRIETAVFNLIRGTKLGGIHGLKRISETLFRPLLDCTKSDITSYAREHDIIFREDASNTDIRYQRNSIRHEILPKFDQINPEYRENIRQFIEHTQDVLVFIDLSIEKWLQNYPVGTFLISEFIEKSPFFQKEIIRYLYTRVHSGTVGLSEGLILELLRFMTEGSNSYGIKEIKKLRLERRGDRVIFGEITKK